MPKHARGTPEYLRPDEFEAWHGTLLAANRVLRALDQGLRAQHGLSVAEFDVLITLANAPDRRLRMAELARSAALSPAGLTHLVTRLERERLVAREVDAGDRRGFHAVLTETGEARLNAMRPLHNRIVREQLLSRMSTADRRRLGAIWKRVRADAVKPRRTAADQTPD